MEAAGLASKEFSAEIKIIKKTSSEYAKEKDPLPCPSVLVNSRIIARNDVVSYKALKTALLSGGDIKGGRP